MRNLYVNSVCMIFIPPCFQSHQFIILHVFGESIFHEVLSLGLQNESQVHFKCKIFVVEKIVYFYL